MRHRTFCEILPHLKLIVASEHVLVMLMRKTAHVCSVYHVIMILSSSKQNIWSYDISTSNYQTLSGCKLLLKTADAVIAQKYRVLESISSMTSFIIDVQLLSADVQQRPTKEHSITRGVLAVDYVINIFIFTL